MTTNPAKTHRAALEEAEVADYLRRHPRFFQRHLDVLETQIVPHPCGTAVSLVTRQLDLLRERNRKLQDQIDELLAIARDNDALFQRIHRLTLALLEADSLAEALSALHRVLHEHFRADFVSVHILEPFMCDEPTMDALVLEAFRRLIEGGQPVCGRHEVLGERLFGGEVQSQALVPLRQQGFTGVLAIGSRDGTRFQADMGRLFLVHMGEIVSARLAALVRAGRRP